MSNTVVLNMKSKKMRAFVSKKNEENKDFSEYSELLEEKDKIENLHRAELESEYKRGYEEAQTETTNTLSIEYDNELLEQSDKFYMILKSFEEKIKEYETNYHKIVIDVSQRIAQKIIMREIDNKSTIDEILEENLRKIIGANEVIIKLNPAEMKIVEKTSKEKMSSSGISKIRFESSDGIQKGGCLIETEIGNLDARIESQISEIIKALETKLTKNVS